MNPQPKLRKRGFVEGRGRGERWEGEGRGEKVKGEERES